MNLIDKLLRTWARVLVHAIKEILHRIFLLLNSSSWSFSFHSRNSYSILNLSFLLEYTNLLVFIFICESMSYDRIHFCHNSSWENSSFAFLIFLEVLKPKVFSLSFSLNCSFYLLSLFPKVLFIISIVFILNWFSFDEIYEIWFSFRTVFIEGRVERFFECLLKLA